VKTRWMNFISNFTCDVSNDYKKQVKSRVPFIGIFTCEKADKARHPCDLLITLIISVL